MDKIRCLRLISENYNRIYLTDKGTILKCFYHRDFYTTEKETYLLLREHGFPFSAKLLSFDDTKLCIELEYYPHDLNYYRDVRFYLELLSYFDDIPLKNLNNFNVDRNLLTIAERLKMKLGNDIFPMLEEICGSTVSVPKRFLHGDFRLENILHQGDQIKIIDFEGSCIGDRNVDYTYLFFSFIVRGRGFRIIKFFSREKYFNINNFKYYFCFLLLRLLENPRVKDKQQIFSLLKEVIKLK